MTLQQFINKWLGGRTDYDHVYQYQCVDLILQYLADCYGITSGVWGNAIDYWTKPTERLLQDFEKVTGTPQAGDIVILNPTSTNEFGHIMIATSATNAIEQNGSTGDGDGLGGDEVRYRTIPTNRVAGLLRKKGNNMSDTETILQSAINAARAQATVYESALNAEREKTKDLEKTVYILQSALNAERNDPNTEFNALGKAVASILTSFGYKKG